MPKAKIQPITLPALKKGEHYAGIVLKDGKPLHHLILLPGEAVKQTWDNAVAWAKKQKADLPTRQEQSLLFANAKQHFQPAWYWSGEQHADYSACAWVQFFDNGGQGIWRKANEVRARVVRRVPI